MSNLERFYRTRGHYPGHRLCFHAGLVVQALRSFPQFDRLASAAPFTWTAVPSGPRCCATSARLSAALKLSPCQLRREPATSDWSNTASWRLSVPQAPGVCAPFLLRLHFCRVGLYLKPRAAGGRTADNHLVSEPSPWASACRSLDADYPILDVVTIPEVITLATGGFRAPAW